MDLSGFIYYQGKERVIFVNYINPLFCCTVKNTLLSLHRQKKKVKMMKYDFDEPIDRSQTDALKLEALKPRWGRNDLLPLWVADMDFKTPPFIMEALRHRCEHEILGYTVKPERYYQAIINWIAGRHHWNIQREWINFIPGVVPGLAYAIHCFTNPGDKILIQPPVYHPFRMIIEKNGRVPVNNPLVLEDGRYTLDEIHFREAVKGCKLFILCNPHNPGGKVWSREDLERMADICYAENVLVLSDEIHADLTLPGYTHTPFASISEKARLNVITYMAASKAFNMPGLSSAYCITENKIIRKRLHDFIEASELAEGHVFAFISVIAAYEKGEEWLKQMIAYVQENIRYMDSYLREHLPFIRIIPPEASFLVFLDCRKLGLNQKELVDMFVDGARLALNDGAMFGEEGVGFMRINVACPRIVLEKALCSLRVAYDKQLAKIK